MSLDLLYPVISTHCPACGAAAGLAPACDCGVQAERTPLVAGPCVDRWTASELLRSSLLVPALRVPEARSAVRPGALQAVLVPAWSIDVDVHSSWSLGRERRGTRTRHCRGLVVPACDDSLAGVLAAALAGCGVEPRETSLENVSEWMPLSVTRDRTWAWTSAREHLAGAAGEEAALGLSLEETERLSVETRFEHGRIRPLLVPAWRARGAGFTVHVEACGGSVVGRFPWNARRLAALAAAAGSIAGLASVLLL